MHVNITRHASPNMMRAYVGRLPLVAGQYLMGGMHSRRLQVTIVHTTIQPIAV